MQVILLSGGSGKGLWPLSAGARAKQFLPLFENDAGVSESMLQRSYRRIRNANPDAKFLVATSLLQEATVRAQIEDDIEIVTEPCPRDTFPAIALAGTYLHDQKALPEDAIVLAAPIDTDADEEYYRTMGKMEEMAKKRGCVCLMGHRPTYPSAKYGYLFPAQGKDGEVASFCEKPSEEEAARYIEEGALWNGGVFAISIGQIRQRAKELLGYDTYDNLRANFAKFPATSFDYAVLEQAKDLCYVPCDGKHWMDLGTWNTLTETMPKETAGDVLSIDCSNTHIINELPQRIIGMGLTGLVVVATADGILVTEKGKASRLKFYVGGERPMTEQRHWGTYRVLDYHTLPEGYETLTKIMTIRAGKSISDQKHQMREESWVVLSGCGELSLAGETKEVRTGEHIKIPQGKRHKLLARTDMEIIETQIGEEVSEEDIVRFDSREE